MNIGIDIGSTASKVVVYDKSKDKILYKILMPSGWNSKETFKYKDCYCKA